MQDFNPIDHKDSDPEYRTEVLHTIEAILDSKLSALDSADELLGEWKRSFPRAPQLETQQVIYRPDGTFRSSLDSDVSRPGKWQVRDLRYTETTWCEPMPAYGIDEGTWNPETYHCAMTDAGDVALWNGDGSLLMLLARCVG